jgi:hypothetical protein
MMKVVREIFPKKKKKKKKKIFKNNMFEKKLKKIKIKISILKLTHRYITSVWTLYVYVKHLAST